MSTIRLASLVSCLAALVVLASGCLVPSGGDPSSFSTGDVLTDVAAFRAGYVAASCEWSRRCCNAADFERAFGVIPTDEQSCQDTFGLDMDAIIERREFALRSGGVAFSPDAAAACLAHIRALPCGTDPETLRWVGPCADVFVGTRVPGDTCSSGAECNNGGDGTNDCRDGICVIIFEPTGPLGTACVSQYQCDEGTFCFEGRCRLGAPVGATCGRPGMLGCAGNYCFNAVCPPPRLDGVSCDRSVLCASGFCSREGFCEQPRCDGIE